MLEAVPDALVGMDQQGVIRFVNRQTEALFGYDRDELIGRHIDTLVPETLYAVYAQHREDYFTDPRTRSSGLELELTARTRDGNDLSVNISMSSIDTGDVLLVITARRDVTKQRRAVEGAQLTAAMVAFSDDAIMSGTLEGVVTSWNPAAERMFGYTREEIIGTYAGRLSPQERAGELKDSLARLKAGQFLERLETVRVRKDGLVFPASITMAPIRDETGAIVGVSVICRDVTEQRRAFESAQRMAAIVESSDDAIIGETIEGVITSWNPAAERMFGYSGAEIIGKTIALLVPEDRLEAALAGMAEVGAGHHVDRQETFNVRKDGTVFPISLSISPILDDGTVIGASVICRDITEQKRAFEAAQQMAAIVDSSNDAIIGSTLDGVMTRWNPAAEQMYGYSAAEVIGRSGRLLSPGDRIGEIKATLAKVRAGQHIEHIETIRVRKDGTTFPVSLTVSPILGESGEVVGASAISRNMTELRNTARYTRSLMEAGLDPLMTVSPQGRIDDVNEATVKITGVLRDQLIGTHCTQYMTEPDKAAEAFRQAFEQGSVRDVPLTMHHQDGTLTPVRCTASVYRDLNGDVLGVLASAHVMTGQRKAFETAQWMAAIVAGSTDAIIGRTLQGVITSWNPSAERIYGYSGEQIIGRSASILVPEGRPDEVDAILAEILAGQTVEHRAITHVRKDGTQFPVALTVSPIRDADGAVVGVSTISRDMTNQILDLEAAQRVEAIVEGSRDAIISGSLDGIIMRWNPAAEAMYGYSGQEILGRSISLLIPGGRAGEIATILDRINEGQAVEGFETMRVRRDGTEFPVSLTISPIRDASGAIVGTSAIHHDMTAYRRRLEIAQRLAAIVESSGDAIIGSTPERIITCWNRGAEAMFGYSSEEMVGRSASLLIPEDQIAAVDEVAVLGLAGQVAHFEMMTARKDGEAIQVSATLSPIFGPDGSVIGGSTICRDVTVQRRAFEAAQRLAAIIEGSDDAIIGRRLDGTIMSWNPAAERMFGYSSAEMIGEPAISLVPADRSDEVPAALARIKAGRLAERLETMRVRKDGTVFLVSITVSPIRDEFGAPAGASVILRDLTEQEHAAQYARSLVEAAMDPLMMIGLDGSISDLNEAAVKIIGLARDELIGSDFTQYVTEPDKAGEVLQRVLTQGWVINAPLTVRHRNGTLTRALCNASAYRDSAGNVLGMLAVARDVTEHLLRDEAVQEVASMVEFIDEAIIGTTLDGVVTSWNPAATRMHGYSADEVVGRSIGLVIPDDRADEVASILARVSAGQVVRGLETVRLRKDGTVFPISITVGPIRDSGGAIVGSTALGRELT